MTNLNLLSADELENTLWKIGLTSHTASSEDQKKYLDFLCENASELAPKTILNAVSYIMHTYFHCMQDEERGKCIRLILCADINKLQNFGDVFDMLGILYKKCPHNLKKEVVNYIAANAMKTLSNPSAIISICNCFSYIFDELEPADRKVVLKTLEQLISAQPYPYLNETLLFTKNLFEKESR